MTLTDFLLARITEDEVVAKKAAHLKTAGPLIGWHPDSAFLMRNDALEKVERAHIARHDPARVLAECAAKRQIIEFHGGNEPYHVDPCDAHDAAFETIPCDTLRAVAAVYADHPDCREEWRP